MLRNFLILIGFFFPFVLVAQERDLASLNWGRASVINQDTAATARQLELKVCIPIWQKGKAGIGTTFGYSNLNLNHFPNQYGTNLHALQWQVAWQHKFSKRKAIVLFGQRKILFKKLKVGACSCKLVSVTGPNGKMEWMAARLQPI